MTAKILVGGKWENIGGTKSINNPLWLREILLDEERSGKDATLYSKSSWAFSCINIRADALAAIPWEIRTKAVGEEEGEALGDDHPAVNLLRTVNPEMNWIDLARAVEADLLTSGKAFWYKAKTTRNKVGGLQRLNPLTMKVDADSQGINGFVQTVGGKDTKFKREEIVYFHAFDPASDFDGVPPLLVVKAEIEAESEADAYLKAFFKNYAMPPTVFSFDQVQEPELRKAERKWYQKFRGTDEQHKTAFVNKLDKVHQLGYNLGELALQEIREESRRSICAAFRVPMPLAGASEAANYATMHEQRKSLYTETIIPRAAYIASVINAELIVHFGLPIEFTFLPDQLDVMQPDQKDHAEWVSRLVESGTINARAGALEMGFTEEDIGPGKSAIFADFEGEETYKPTQAQPKEDPDEEVKSMRADLEKWCRKALKRFSEGQGASVEFASEHIPLGLGEAIGASLDGARDKDDIKAIFQSVYEYEHMPYVRKKDDDVNDRQYEELKTLIMAMGGNRGTSILQMDGKTFDMEQFRPSVKVDVQPTPVNVDVHVPEQAAPVVEVKAMPTVEVSPTPVEIVNEVKVPKLAHSYEQSKVKRGKDKLIDGTDKETVYEYEE